MIKKRYYHKSLAIKNKLFVICGVSTPTCEVFDSTCNKFVLLKPPPTENWNYRRKITENLNCPAGVILNGNKLAVFGDYSKSILFYDVENEEWSNESWELTKNLRGFCCAKIPQL